MFPKPRDYRPGIYKFTSTNPVNAKPTRADLRKTIRYGLHGTSMPGFEATMTPDQIEQVIDYMTFLSMRGETERYLIDEAMNSDDKDAEAALGEDVVKEMIDKVVSSWKEAETQVVNPTARRVPPSAESVQRGRDLYLGSQPGGAQTGMRRLSRRLGPGQRWGVHRPRNLPRRRPPVLPARPGHRPLLSGRERVQRPRHKAKADPAGVAKFLEENPPVVVRLRKTEA